MIITLLPSKGFSNFQLINLHFFVEFKKSTQSSYVSKQIYELLMP